MFPLQSYVADCLAQRLLEASPIQDLYWSTQLGRKVDVAVRSRRGGSVLLDLGDFMVGNYSTLKARKRDIDAMYPGSWSGTEIHHIVENFHLQFLGVVQPVSELTYREDEPCVLLSKKHHDTHFNGIIGDAERVIMETLPVDFVTAFQQAHPGISEMDRTRQGQARADWVRAQERAMPPVVHRRMIRDALVETYNFAYQLPELRPLRLIARSVIAGMPL